MIVIADERKWVVGLGAFPLPVEVVPFGLAATRRAIEARGSRAGPPGPALLRRTKAAMLSSPTAGTGSSMSLFERISDPAALAARLVAIPGVVDHGLFIGLADHGHHRRRRRRPRRRAAALIIIREYEP